MLDPIDYEIIDDIVRVCRDGGPPQRPDRLRWKAYHARGGRFSCADINERGSYSWFCAAATLATYGVDIRAEPPDKAWQALLSRRMDGVRNRVFDDWLAATSVQPSATASQPPPLSPPQPPISPRAVRLAIGPAKPRPPRVRNAYVVATQIIAIVEDVRRVAAAINAPTVGAVQWSDYRAGGGRFTREQIYAVSTWPAVRAAADLAKGLDAAA